MKTTRPFRFEHSLRFLEGFSPMAGEQTISDGRLRKAVRTRGRTVLFSVREASRDHSALEVSLSADAPITAAVARDTFDRVGFFLSVDDDLEPFYAAAREDERLSRMTGVRQNPCVADVFTCAVAQARESWWSRLRKKSTRASIETRHRVVHPHEQRSQ